MTVATKAGTSAAAARDVLAMHGLTVDSEVSLHHPRRGPHPAAVGANLIVHRGEDRKVPQDTPPGRVLAATFAPDGQPFMTFLETSRGYLLRCHGICDVSLDAGASTATCHRDPAQDPELLPVVITGMLVAMVLVLRGALVLHASAVEIAGSAIAVVGRSGMGKSTLATLLCGAGARLVTDDVLRVEPGPPAHCWLGSTESRLRPAAATLADEFHVRDARATADGRTALTLPRSDVDPLPLVAVLVPWPDRSATEVSVEWQPPARAMLTLSAFPRLTGWTDPRTNAQQFELLGGLVRTVPVGVARVPWGPPFDADVGRTLLSACLSRLGMTPPAGSTAPRTAPDRP
jgi:hypothetical protein